MNKKGVALLLAIFTLLIVSLLAVAFLEVTTSDLQIINNHYNRNKALYIAEAGVEFLIDRLERNRSNFSLRSYTFPAGSGDSYAVEYSATSGIIISTGRLASGEQVTLQVKVAATGSRPYTVKILYWKEG
ncbi:MAG: pilus assembly PilX N-terminal domain-containing protein [Candidatus Omnitrophota bacterium]